MSASSFHASTSISTEDHDTDDRSVASSDCIVHGELENQDEVKRLSLNSFHLWGLGISIVIGGQYIGWNETLQAGFGSALIATVLITSAYVCLICCMAEVSSAIPFGGGSYGIARVTLGFFPGYMVAFMEASQNIIFVASAAVTFGEIITSVTYLSRGYEPLYWIFFYVTSLTLQICGGRTFWYMIMGMAVVSIGLLLIYVFGSIPDFDFDRYALLNNETGADRWFRSGGMNFMRVLPLPCWFYLGVESINLACKDVPNPRVQVPRGYLSCIATLVVMSFAVLFCCSSLSPGITLLMDEVDPLHIHFEVIFSATHTAANTIVMPSIYAMCSGFMYCYGKQLKAMGKSGLIHPFFAHNYKGYKMPVIALVVGSALSLLVALMVYFIEVLTERHLFILCLLCAFSAYASQFASFIIFRHKFATIKREYESPLGVAGAVYGFLVFTLAFIGAVGFQRDFIPVSLFVVLVVLVVAYYFWAAQDRQSFSEEEKQVMFRAYLLKSNNDRNRRIKKGKIAQVGVAVHATHSNVDSLQNKHKSSVSGAAAVETPRTTQVQEDSGAFQVSTLGIATAVSFGDTAPRHRTPRRSTNNAEHPSRHQAQPVRVVSPKSYSSQRVKLLVDTGSGRIIMTGEVGVDELYGNAALQGVLQDNEDVMLVDEEAAAQAGSGTGVEVLTLSHTILLSSADTVHNNYSKHGDNDVEFTDIEHLDV